MKIELTPQESEEYFFNALCNGIDYISGYGLLLDYSSEDANKAKKMLKKETICREDVWLQILKDGGTLKIEDQEGEGEYNSSITLSDVHERVQLTPASHLVDMANEQDDAGTADAILQTVFFKEIIFG